MKRVIVVRTFSRIVKFVEFRKNVLSRSIQLDSSFNIKRRKLGQQNGLETHVVFTINDEDWYL